MAASLSSRGTQRGAIRERTCSTALPSKMKVCLFCWLLSSSMSKRLHVEFSEMSEFVSENSENPSECEACSLLKRAAKPLAGESVQDAIYRVARQLHWSFARAKAVWYREARRIDAREMDQLRRLAAEQAARFERIAQAMRNTDPDMYEQDIIALLSAARALGGEDQT